MYVYTFSHAITRTANTRCIDVSRDQQVLADLRMMMNALRNSETWIQTTIMNHSE